jgi:Lamin Tail Domain
MKSNAGEPSTLRTRLIMSARHLGIVVGAGVFVGAAACAPGTAPAAPTAQAVVTQAVGAASPAAATAVAAAPGVAQTAVAAASPVAATAVAAVSPAVATVTAAAPGLAATAAAAVSPGVASPTALAPIVVAGVQPSATDTTITIRNQGNAVVDLAGWQLRVGTATARLPSGARVEQGQTLTVHTGTGTTSGSDVYLGSDGPALLAAVQPGATIALIDQQNRVVSELIIPR